MPDFSIGQLRGERLTIHILQRSYPECSDYWDGNWLDTKVKIQTGGFRGSFGACLRAEDFIYLRSSFKRLSTSISGQLEFEAMEEQIHLKITGDGKGHFSADCILMDEAGTGNRLECTLFFDQSCIPSMLQQLDEIARIFPVHGNLPIDQAYSKFISSIAPPCILRIAPR